MSENINRPDDREIVRSPFKADEEAPYIFISYSHVDRERVFPIIKRLYEQGWRIWYDEGLEIAANYLATLSRHIKDCATFLLFVTENSVKSDFVCEKELTTANNFNRIIVQCVLDENALFTGEAKDVIDIVTASRKHPRTDDAGLEATLRTIEGLTCGEKREAKGITIHSNIQLVTASEKGEYEWTTCEGGVRLTKYLGSDEVVHIPSEYPTGSGQAVVELAWTFSGNKTVRVIFVSESVREINKWTFDGTDHLNDVYIPSSVSNISKDAFGWWGKTEATIHSSKGSAAHRYALYEKKDFIEDETLRVSESPRKESDGKAYVYCSYAPDRKKYVAQILAKLTEAGCEICDGGSLSEGEKLGEMYKSCCFAAFISNEYLQSNCVNELLTASASHKELMMYILEDCDLPSEIATRHPADQRLYYNSLNEEERMANLVNWLEKNGCRKMTAIPDFEYTATKSGITLTKYIGKGRNVVIEKEYDGVLVKAIRGGAFSGCSGLTSVTIPDSVEEIGSGAFSGCSGLTSITIPDSVKEIRDNVFSGCSGLISIFIPDSVTEIGEHAFYNCSELTSITIPDSVTEIDHYAFSGCRGLTDIIISENHKLFCSIEGVLFSKDKAMIVAYPGNHGEHYEIPGSVTRIGEGAFFGQSELASVTIPDFVKEIGKRAFSGCSGLNSVIIPDSVIRIGEEAFSGCSGLNSVIIPDSVTKFGYGAFDGCGNLTIYCNKASAAWNYCVKEKFPCKELFEAPTPASLSTLPEPTPGSSTVPALIRRPRKW